jgi:putative lipase involved disintegration of autophagic bodies
VCVLAGRYNSQTQRLCRFLKCLQLDGLAREVSRHICDLLASGEVDRDEATLYVCGHSLGGAMAGLFAGANCFMFSSQSTST